MYCRKYFQTIFTDIVAPVKFYMSNQHDYLNWDIT